MSVDKVILRAFLNTLAAVGVLIAFLITSLCAVFPSTMMQVTYDLGMEKASIHFAERAYKESDDIFCIAYATEVAIGEGRTGKIATCGEKFLNHEDFYEYTQGKGGAYRHLIYAQVCVAKYEQGNRAQAIELAYSSLAGGYPAGNAMTALVVAAIEKQDAATLTELKGKLSTLTVEGEDSVRLQDVLKALGE